MAPAKYDMAIYQGDDHTMLARFSANGLPFNLTGWTFSAQIRTDVADAAPDPPAAAMVCQITAPATLGEISITLPHTASDDLPLEPLRWDLQGVDPAGTVTTFVAGKVKVTGEVTRP